MTRTDKFSNQAERWANELWNVSLLPLSPVGNSELTQSRLENIDERRRLESIRRPLRVSCDSRSGIVA
jgi:hypothetical protein